MLKKVLIGFLILILVVAGTGIGAFYYVSKKIYTPTSRQASTGQSNSTQDDNQNNNVPKGIDGVENILLTGLDARGKDADSRTDSIIVATVDGKNDKIKLTSFMRDMYVEIPGHGKGKINSAFFYGGPELLIETLNKNFNLNINYYATIDFHAFQDLVDKLGGVDVDVKSYEIKQINKYIKEENWSNPDYIKNAGYQHLNGQQALSYCRIRKVGNNDYERTERQRRVLSLLIEKTRKSSIFKLPGLFTTLLPYIKTDIPSDKLLGFGYSIYKFSGGQTDTLRIPADGMFTSGVINRQDVLIPDLDKNNELLNNFITSKDVSQYVASSVHTTKSTKSKNSRKRTKRAVTAAAVSLD